MATTQDFKVPEDIANQGLQYLGATRIVTFADNSKNSSATAFCYDKLRKAELRRNVWRFATKRMVLRPITVGTVTFTPAVWLVGTTYSIGAIVLDSTGDWWQSKQSSNTGNAAVQGAFWRRYTGNDYADPWDYTASTNYFVGETVLVPSTWSSAITYGLGEVVSNPTDGKYYVSLNAFNINSRPDQAPAFWQLYQSFITGTLAGAIPLFTRSPTIYLSMGSNNAIGPTAAASGINWLNLGVTSVANLQILYPLGAGPLQDTKTLNIMRLPRGFLRQAPTDPKAGTPNDWLGARLAPMEEDYVFEGNYFVTNLLGSTMFRYVSDFVDVADMDAMFCEMLACRIAVACCQELTQSVVKQSEVNKAYKEFAFEARLVNAIEKGADEPPLDPYIACRF